MKNKDLIFSFKEKFLIKSTNNFINKNYVHFSSNFSPSYRDFYLSVFESLDYFLKRELVENYNAKDIKFPISIDLNDGEKTKILKKSEKIIRIINNFKGQKKTNLFLPTVCYHFFLQNYKKKLKKNNIITSTNICSRIENIKSKSFYRLNYFTMREGIIISQKKDVLIFLKNMEDLFKKLLIDFNLSFKIIYANDIFINNSQKKFQSLTKPKKEIIMPISKKKYISVFSSNFHSRSITTDFKINGSFFSGCVGFGLDRITYCLFKQLGGRRSQWPKNILKKLNI